MIPAKRVIFRRRFICWHCRRSLAWKREDKGFVGYEVFVKGYRRIVHGFCGKELGVCLSERRSKIMTWIEFATKVSKALEDVQLKGDLNRVEIVIEEDSLTIYS